MSKMELIQSLIEQVEQLPHRDRIKLSALIMRADMIIRQVFGDSSRHLKSSKAIRFYPVVDYIGRSRNEQEHNERWALAQQQMLALFSTMKEELQISASLKESHPHPIVDDVEKTVVGKSNRIFIVHGHDEEMKQAVALTLRKLDIEPIILNEKPYLGKTIIEKFTHYADVPFAVVLLSPDDMVYHKDGSREIVAIRARQNVIFELGFFIGKLGRERVLVLHSEGKILRCCPIILA